MVNLGHFLIQVFHRNIACIVSFNLTLIVGRVNDSVGQLDIIDMQKSVTMESFVSSSFTSQSNFAGVSL